MVIKDDTMTMLRLNGKDCLCYNLNYSVSPVRPKQSNGLGLRSFLVLENMMNNNGEGWIYLIDGGNGLYKIGCTVNLAHRLSEFNYSSPVEVKYVHYFRSKHMTGSEKWLLDKYQEVRHHGEWFRLSNEQIREIISFQDYGADEALEKFWKQKLNELRK